MTTRAAPPVGCCAPLAAPTLSPQAAAATAALFKALADPSRVRILNLLATNPAPVCVCDLVAALHLAQPTVSHHLKKLTDAGLLTRTQRGTWAYYTLHPQAMTRLAAITAPPATHPGDNGERP
jgi:ArsR family transcriptional regulator